MWLLSQANAQDMMDCERCKVFLVDEEKSELYSFSAGSAATANEELRIPISVGLCGHVATTGEELCISDTVSDERFNPEVDNSLGIQTTNMLLMPLKCPVEDGKEKTMGVAQLINKRNDDFNAEDKDLLRAFAAQAAVAIRNAQLFAEANQMRSYLEALLGNITSTVISLDNSGNFVSSNHDLMPLLGVATDSLAGKPYSEWLLDNEELSADIARVYENPVSFVETPIYKENYVYAKAAKESAEGDDAEEEVEEAEEGDNSSHVTYTVKPLIIESKPQGTLLIMDDVTEQKKTMCASSAVLFLSGVCVRVRGVRDHCFLILLVVAAGSLLPAVRSQGPARPVHVSCARGEAHGGRRCPARRSHAEGVHPVLGHPLLHDSGAPPASLPTPPHWLPQAHTLARVGGYAQVGRPPEPSPVRVCSRRAWRRRTW